VALLPRPRKIHGALGLTLRQQPVRPCAGLRRQTGCGAGHGLRRGGDGPVLIGPDGPGPHGYRARDAGPEAQPEGEQAHPPQEPETLRSLLEQRAADRCPQPSLRLRRRNRRRLHSRVRPVFGFRHGSPSLRRRRRFARLPA